MTTINPVPAKTVGQSVDAELAAIRQWMATQEANAKVDVGKVEAWFKSNWAHLVTWLGTGLTVAKVFGKL
jgi:hypothetical protein